MQIRPAQVVVALDIAREAFAAVKRGDATVDQAEVVELAIAAKMHPDQVDAAVDVAIEEATKPTSVVLQAPRDAQMHEQADR